MSEPPLIDKRAAADIERETRDRLLHLISRDAEWPGPPCDSVDSRGALAALIAVFGRFSEVVIACLNRTPQKNLLAFLNLIGVARRPPQPARVPLTFGLATGSVHPVAVKPGTQAAAAPAKGESQPAIFETVRELVVSPVRLVAAYMMDHDNDRYFSWMPAIGPDALDFQGSSPVEHVLYLGFGGALDLPVETDAALRFALEKSLHAPLDVVWEIHTDKGWQKLVPVSDETRGLSSSGIVRFKMPASEPTPVHDTVSRWIRASLLTRINGKIDLPAIRSVALETTGGKDGLLAASAFAEFQPIDLTRDFLPFGARPAFGSTFYITNPEALAVTGGDITLHVELTNPAAGGPEPPIPRTTVSGNLRLAWEVWTGLHWERVGISETAADSTTAHPDFQDTTRAFTRSGTVRFHLAAPAVPARVNGILQPWLRVRIISGDYGVLPPPAPQAPGIQQPAQLAVLSPPAIHAVTMSYRVVRTKDRPELILAYNDFWWQDETSFAGSFQPFRSDKSLAVAVYFGFDPPQAALASLGNRSLSLYFVCDPSPLEDDEAITPPIEWQYWGGSSWLKWTVRDETEAFTESAPVRSLPPPGFARRTLFDRNIYWLRAVWTGARPPSTSIRRVLMNTVEAVNAETVLDETLGSSNGTPNQVFRTLRSPVLEGPVIEIREPQRPLEEERRAIECEEGTDAIREVTRNDGTTEFWVRWHEVQDFLRSRPLDRHYVFDHISGEIAFGDNHSGMIPPAGVGNMRAASYRTGGGSSGNRAPGTINTLKTAIPYVDRVSNYEPAQGGVDAEDENDLPRRGPAYLRHRERAVAREDYEDLAQLASPEVGRARCVPARDLASDPDGRKIHAGKVTVIIVPRTGLKPVPDSTLIETVHDYLDARKALSAELTVVGPTYVRIDVDVEIGLDSLDSGDVELAATLALRDYLHPLTGGPHGTGWQFGRRVRASELHKVIEPLPGVRYVARIEVKECEERKNLLQSNLFLIYSGQHTVRLLPPED